MSHFSVYVLVNEKPRNEGHADDLIKPLLAPYDENKEVEPYQEDCYCLQSAVRKAGTEAAQAYKPFVALRGEFWEREDIKPLATEKRELEKIHYGLEGVLKRDLTKEERDRFQAIEDEIDAAWKPHIAEYKRIDQEAQAEAAKTAKPDPECEGCSGTGKCESTRNPQSKWDWYTIGGRWSGAFLPEDEREKLSKGWSGFSFDRPAFPSHADIAPAAKALEARPPYALVTPEGEWIGRGRMGWFGMSADDIPKTEWAAKVRETLERYPNAFAVNVDCHI